MKLVLFVLWHLTCTFLWYYNPQQSLKCSVAYVIKNTMNLSVGAWQINIHQLIAWILHMVCNLLCLALVFHTSEGYWRNYWAPLLCIKPWQCVISILLWSVLGNRGDNHKVKSWKALLFFAFVSKHTHTYTAIVMCCVQETAISKVNVKSQCLDMICISL